MNPSGEPKGTLTTGGHPVVGCPPYSFERKSSIWISENHRKCQVAGGDGTVSAGPGFLSSGSSAAAAESAARTRIRSFSMHVTFTISPRRSARPQTGHRGVRGGLYRRLLADSVVHMVPVGLQRRCPLLLPDGRCSVHDRKPTVCALYPLGRVALFQDVKDKDAEITRENIRVKYIINDYNCGSAKSAIPCAAGWHSSRSRRRTSSSSGGMWSRSI